MVHDGWMLGGRPLAALSLTELEPGGRDFAVGQSPCCPHRGSIRVLSASESDALPTTPRWVPQDTLHFRLHEYSIYTLHMTLWHVHTVLYTLNNLQKELSKHM